MSSSIIPKEQLTAYQRYELGSFDSPPRGDSGRGDSVSGVALPTVEDVDRVYAEARAEGKAAGIQEGRAEGLAQGRAAAESERDQVRRLLADFSGLLASLERDLAEDVLAVALAVARQIVRQAIAVRPELVLTVIREAVAGLPQVVQPARLLLHPDDAALVRAAADAQAERFPWVVVEDGSMERGSCRLETATSEIDATLESRWKRTIAALGRSDAWLDPAADEKTPIL